MGSLYYSLSDIPLNITNKCYAAYLDKYFGSQKNPFWVHEDLEAYDIGGLSDAQRCILKVLAVGYYKRYKIDLDLSFIPDSSVFSKTDVLLRNLSN